MPSDDRNQKICSRCRYYRPSVTGRFEHGICVERSIVRLNGRRSSTFLRIMAAREVCDREGDGRFVHFEPVAQLAGVAAADVIDHLDRQRLRSRGLESGS